MLFDYNSIRYLFYCVSLSDSWAGRVMCKKVPLFYIVTDITFFVLPFPFSNILSLCLFCWKKIAKTKHCSVTELEKKLRHSALQVSDKNFHFLKPKSWTYSFVEVSRHNLESSQTWGFRLQCSHYKPVSSRFCSRGGRKLLVEVTVNSKEDNSSDFCPDYVLEVGLSPMWKLAFMGCQEL